MPTPSGKTQLAARPGALARAWLAVPDGAFRALGAVFFLAYFGWRLSDYVRLGFWQAGAYKQVAPGTVLYLPYGRVLVEATYLLIALSFCFRLPPRDRAARAREILLPIMAAFWPFVPFAAAAIIGVFMPAIRGSYEALLFDRMMGTARFVAGSALIIIGNILDVWGYAGLFRSFSIVAEARALKTTGPYRWVRHPIYLGQFLAQAGVWLCYAAARWEALVFYSVFVALQLYRSKVEDEVLERSFGDRYRDWKRRTFWFW